MAGAAGRILRPFAAAGSLVESGRSVLARILRRQGRVASAAAATAPIPADAKPVCCLVHVFYTDLWPELAAHLRNLDGTPADIRINIVDRVADAPFLAEVRADFPSAHICVSPNRGRDWGGFFRLMQDVDFSRHDVFCLVHTKRSPHMIANGGRKWRRSLLRAILGSREKARRNIAAMLHDPAIGIIGARKQRSTRLTSNGPYYHQFLDRLGLEGDLRRCEFVAGSMMLVRKSVLQSLFATFGDIEFESSDVPLRDHLDGQTAHSLERVVGNIARSQGMEILWR